MKLVERKDDEYLASLGEFIPNDTTFDYYMALSLVRPWPSRFTSKHFFSPLSGVEVRPGYVNLSLLNFCRTVPGKLRGEEPLETRQRLLFAAYGDLSSGIGERTDKAGTPGLPWPNSSYAPLEAIVLKALERLKTGGLVIPKGGLA